MSSWLGLTSARRNTLVSCGGQAILTVREAALLQRDESAHFQVETRRRAAVAAFPAMGAAVAPTPVGDDYATTKHIGNGGLRGPQPWRHRPVMN